MSTVKIRIIGIGYVGLPLAMFFATKYAFVGFGSKNFLDKKTTRQVL
jgi:UDP-N-acetyl-D-mannosaminuronate dehydrogenase